MTDEKKKGFKRSKMLGVFRIKGIPNSLGKRE